MEKAESNLLTFQISDFVGIFVSVQLYVLVVGPAVVYWGRYSPFLLLLLTAILDDVIFGRISLKGQLYSAECHPSPKRMTGLFITFNRDMVIGTRRNVSTPYEHLRLLKNIVFRTKEV